MNVKALLRRAQALSNLGDDQTALKDVKTVLDAEPSNEDARKVGQTIRAKIKKETEIEKGLFGKMFKGLSAA